MLVNSLIDRLTNSLLVGKVGVVGGVGVVGVAGGVGVVGGASSALINQHSTASTETQVLIN